MKRFNYYNFSQGVEEMMSEAQAKGYCARELDERTWIVATMESGEVKFYKMFPERFKISYFTQAEPRLAETVDGPVDILNKNPDGTLNGKL